MVKIGAPTRHEPIPIGDVATPQFVKLPEPASLFAIRFRRFRKLAEGHHLKPYLLFLAGLCEAQHALQADLPTPELLQPDALTRSREFGMPPLDRNRFFADPVFETTLDRLIALARAIDMPDAAAAALARVAAGDLSKRYEMAQ